MKKTIYTSLLVAGIMLAGTTVNAQVVSTQSAAGKTVTIPDTNGSGPDLTFEPSPNNVMVVSSDINAYAITTMNTAAADGDRMEFGIWFNNTGYYQQINPDSAAATPVASDLSVDLTAATDITVNPFSAASWTAIGGGGS